MRRRATGRLLAAVAALAAAATAVQAHDTWLVPTSARVAVGGTVDLHLSSGMTFAADDVTIDPERIVKAAVRIGGTSTRIVAREPHPMALHLPWTAPAPGVAVFGVSLRPRDLELSAAQVDEYIADINAGPDVKAAYQRTHRWRERYAKHATTFVCVTGGGGRDSGWTEPVGLALEMVPASDPTALRAGDSLRVHVLSHGLPVEGFAIGAERDADPHPVFRRTDADGAATIVLPQNGWWLVHGTLLRPATVASRDWDSDFVTMTLYVGERGAPAGCR
ncbi:MAG TPA: DUF4198 domain-containing protein [Gemmatimonadaceae bacterium]|nr:DUF4198 domain-containing protein [Gemmatimonadaceae bacterium]